MNPGPDGLQSAETVKELTAFHRSLWCLCGKNGNGCACTSPVKDEHVLALLDQGYGYTDIGIMFGLSRERIRQLAARNGSTKPWRGSLPRCWDPLLSRFRAVSREEWRLGARLRARLQNKKKRLAAMEFRHSEMRERHVQILCELSMSLGRAPVSRELEVACGIGLPSILMAWGYNNPATRRDGSASRAMTALYNAAGLTKPRIGGGGHVSGQHCRKLTDSQVEAVWNHPQPYGIKAIAPITIRGILQRRTYRDVTEGWPAPRVAA